MPVIQTTKELKPRPVNDYYLTPYELCAQAVKLLDQPIYGQARVLDPGPGTGVWGEAYKRETVAGPNAYIVGVEIDPRTPHPVYDEWHHGDFLSYPAEGGFEFVIGNPPYRLAEEFVRKGLEHLVHGGQLIYLLRLDFLASRKRALGLYAEYAPEHVYVCSTRPSFTGDGKANAMEYAVFMWRNSRYKMNTRVHFWDWAHPLKPDETAESEEAA